MNVQLLEYNADIRIKFASINANGTYVPDAHDEYKNIFGDLMQGWTCKEEKSGVATRIGFRSRAWAIKHTAEKIELAAVEHETGIEILFDIGKELVTAAVIALIKWSWKKWRTARASSPNKVQASLIVERVTNRLPNGKIRTVQRLEIRWPIDDRTFQRAVRQMLSKTRNGK